MSLANYSVEVVSEFARRVIERFAPRLILGMSDEISPVGEIKKIQAISELVNSIYGLAD